MAITLTEKFADKVDERYHPISVTSAGVNQNYDWDGAKTIKVTSVGTVEMKDYNRTTGYGAVSTADELTNELQTLTLTKILEQNLIKWMRKNLKLKVEKYLQDN